jgi:2-dehydro-3-deoxy-D-gluconate 5-dehydrogenase
MADWLSVVDMALGASVRRGHYHAQVDLFDLHGKAAIVTGGNGGIGLGIARGLGLAGAAVALAGRNEDKTRGAVAELEAQGIQAIGVRVDVTDAEQVRQAIDATTGAFGGLDILVANAGTNVRKRPEEYSIEDWHFIVDTNLTSVFACCQAAYPEFKKRGGGKVLTIGSMTSIFGFNVGSIYATTKGGVVQLTRSLAAAWASDNIQVNCILPGWIDTDLTRGARQNLPQLHDAVVQRTPTDRWGNPDDLMGAAVFYCSPASGFVTGTALPVDGGFSSSMF